MTVRLRVYREPTKFTFKVLILIAMFLSVYCKGQKKEWNITYSGPCHWPGAYLGVNSVSKYIDSDSLGNVYSAKVYRSCEIGTSLAKHSPQGQLLWTFNAGHLDIQSIKVEKSGNCYITGLFIDSLNINGTILSDTLSYGTGVYAKLDSQGNCIWAFKLPPRVLLNDITIGSDYIYAVGECYFINAQINSDFIPANHNFISKIKFDGTIISAKPFANIAHCKYIRKDKDGSYYVAGDYSSNLQIGTGSSTFYLPGATPGNVFVTKLDSSVKPIWAKHASTYGGKLNGLELDSKSNVFISGTLQYYFTFDNYYAQTTGSNMFLLKADPVGNMLLVSVEYLAHNMLPTGSAFNKNILLPVV